MSNPHETASQAIQASPSLTAIILWLSGKDVSFWAGFAGFAFICLQIAYLIWKWRRDIRRDRLEFPPLED